MKLLFVTIQLPNLSFNIGGFYSDMIKEVVEKGHDVTVVTSSSQKQTSCSIEGQVTVIRTYIPFFSTNTSLLRKGISSILMTPLFISALKKQITDWKFDAVVIPTPPATLNGVAEFVKKKSGCKIYTILRDIQPECSNRPYIVRKNEDSVALDESKIPFSINPIAYRFLYRQSQKLYRLSDMIGCMSPGNIDFVKTITPVTIHEKLRLLPNWYSILPKESVDTELVRSKYGLNNKTVAIFGGNIGPQQAIWNIVTLAEHYRHNSDVRFLVVGKGTKAGKLRQLLSERELNNVLCLDYMPREEYEAILQTADIGIISLDEKYVVPTCPSKVIGYMAMKKPVIAMINEGSDYGDFYISESGCGLWSAGLDNKKMFENFDWLISHPKERLEMGERGYCYFLNHFSTDAVCSIFCKQLE